MTLSRQFPDVGDPGAVIGADDVVELFRRIGPVQSQAPRAPFTAAAARLPGVRHDAVVAAFESYALVKNSTLRGTVHTVPRDGLAAIASVAQSTRVGPFAAHLKLQRASLADLLANVEAFCDQWRPRAEVVAHARAWLAEHEGERAAALLDAPYGANLVWGHTGLIRRPADQRWERRTDTLHRTASGVLGPLDPPDEPLAALVRTHLAAHGPASRRDLAWWSGAPLGQVDAALLHLGDEAEQVGALDSATYWDLAGAHRDGAPPAGVRLLPEYDALICAYAPDGRGRFLPNDHAKATEALQHRQYSPLVLFDGRVVGTWRLVTTAQRAHLELTSVSSKARRFTSGLLDATAATGRANDLDMDENVRLPANS